MMMMHTNLAPKMHPCKCSCLGKLIPLHVCMRLVYDGKADRRGNINALRGCFLSLVFKYNRNNCMEFEAIKLNNMNL